MARRYATPEESFAARTQLNPETGCLEWTGGKDRYGYGKLKAAGKTKGAHRFAWELAYGEIPAGMFIDHTCHNRACVNVEHLRLATPAENSYNRKGSDTGAASGVRNVSWHTDDQMWQVQVAKDGVNHFIGKFKNIEHAELAAKKARERLFGEFAGKG